MVLQRLISNISELYFNNRERFTVKIFTCVLSLSQQIKGTQQFFVYYSISTNVLSLESYDGKEHCVSDSHWADFFHTYSFSKNLMSPLQQRGTAKNNIVATCDQPNRRIFLCFYRILINRRYIYINRRAFIISIQFPIGWFHFIRALCPLLSFRRDSL